MFNKGGKRNWSEFLSALSLCTRFIDWSCLEESLSWLSFARSLLHISPRFANWNWFPLLVHFAVPRWKLEWNPSRSINWDQQHKNRRSGTRAKQCWCKDAILLQEKLGRSSFFRDLRSVALESFWKYFRDVWGVSTFLCFREQRPYCDGNSPNARVLAGEPNYLYLYPHLQLLVASTVTRVISFFRCLNFRVDVSPENSLFNHNSGSAPGAL